MTHAERKALLEKHQSDGDGRCGTCHYVQDFDGMTLCTAPPYPCDVIKVLDYLDLVEPTAQEINWAGGK